MKLLTLDTATESCSVAITDQARLRVEINLSLKQTHARHIMVMVDQALALARLSLQDMNGFGIVSGPGTFTGLRIGMSTIKALSVAVAKPVATVSSLRALAWQNARRPGLICPMIDARRGEVYAAIYRFDGSHLVEAVAPLVCAAQQVVARVEGPCLFVGSGCRVYAQLVQDRAPAGVEMALAADDLPRASAAGVLCTQKILQGQAVAIDKLTPLYLRKSDAELKFGPAFDAGESR